MILDLYPPGCGALFLLRGAEPACKKQTAFLLRLANFPGGRRSALVKIGALRQRRLPISSTGRGRRRCPCSASPVSAAGSGSAAQPSTLLSVSPLPLRGSPLALSQFSRRATARPCENWSAAPASPRCICRRQRSVQLPPFGGISAVTSPLSTKPGGAFWWMRQKSPQRKPRSSSQRPRAPVWGRARRAGGTLKGWRVGLDKILK